MGNSPAVGAGQEEPLAPAAILTDIEGTTTPIAFVQTTLFPYAREIFPRFLQTHAAEPAVIACLAEVARLAPDRKPLDSLLDWMAADAKVTPLKTLQGLIWFDGYRSGALKGVLYPDVAPALRAWHDRGRKLYVYSSGSEAAQRLLFGHSDAGNLEPLFSGFFDTLVGAKRERASYATIAAHIGMSPEHILFLSDVAPELDAAAAAGMRTCQIMRAEDGTVASPNHRTAASFADV